MATRIDTGALAAMLRRVAADIDAHHEELSRLDSQGGDGDHGTTMRRAMQRAIAAVDECEPGTSPGKLLEAVGWAVMGVDGGATGPLLGTLFSSMGEATGEADSLDAVSLADAFEAGLAGVERRTRARVGDKTMMDALVPAVAALRPGAEGGAELGPLLAAAAEAAERGAESTRDLVARFGRAKNVGERSAGHRDPGAVSMAIIFRGLEKGAE